MNDIQFCKKQLEDFLKEKDLVDRYNTLDLYSSEKDLEDILKSIYEIKNFTLVENFAVETICEHLLISASYKIERSGMKLGLHRMEKILEILDNPERDLNVIHVAGTNGKGSTSSYIKDVLKIKYTVGFYSSPGMLGFNDRIRINDTFITYKRAYELFKFIQRTWKINNPEGTENLSFFEIITVVAILYFREQNTDFVIMEVGLGGKFDATNIFKNKILSIITMIGLDHTDILGDTLEKIATEKAGIIQEHDNVLIYPTNKEVVSLITDVCDEQRASLTVLDFNDITNKKVLSRGCEFDFKNLKNIKLKMIGEHQIYNASLALLALMNLRERAIIKLSDATIIREISSSTWAGRLEWITDNVLLDGAHNKDGMHSLVTYLKTQNFKNLKLLIAILEDKDYKEMIDNLQTLDAEFYITKVPIEVKKSSIENIENSFTKKNITSFENYNEALKNILPNLKKDDTLVISGSLYLVSEVRKYIVDYSVKKRWKI